MAHASPNPSVVRRRSAAKARAFSGTVALTAALIGYLPCEEAYAQFRDATPFVILGGIAGAAKLLSDSMKHGGHVRPQGSGYGAARPQTKAPAPTAPATTTANASATQPPPPPPVNPSAAPGGVYVPASAASIPFAPPDAPRPAPTGEASQLQPTTPGPGAVSLNSPPSGSSPSAETPPANVAPKPSEPAPQGPGGGSLF